MVLHPEVQKKAQAELDRVVPHDRLPNFSDRDKLPYLECLVWECLRWNPAVNISLAHLLTENDDYKGYKTPKGTTVLDNIWSILHDAEVCAIIRRLTQGIYSVPSSIIQTPWSSSQNAVWILTKI
ncbi:hypothetical protein C0993_011867 [Termitomyces sp. T159_Od127]|nr:hypothetical protein C0993_011867 [Termitomyces sp. T159_Od127]